MTDSPVITTEEFLAFTPYAKGYAVYMCDDHSDQPNIPEVYTPLLKDDKDFYRGVCAAMLEIIESGG